MSFSDAMRLAEAGAKLTLPSWYRLYVSRDGRGTLSLFDADGGRLALFRATRREKRAADWHHFGDDKAEAA